MRRDRRMSICESCGAVFFRIASRLKKYKHHFCSHRCFGTHMSKKLGEKSHCWNGGRSESYGYVLVRNKNHPNSTCGYVREHILKMTELIGRPLEKNECVHHVDGNKKNNNIKNLMLMTKKEHAKFHANERKKNAKSL